MSKHPDVDPRMWGVENADAKMGNHMSPRRLRYLRHDMANAQSLGRIGRKIVRRIGRRFIPAA